jgi:hypothetical protein
MAEGIDAAIDPVQAARRGGSPDRRRGETELLQLVVGHDPVLPRRKFRHPRISWRSDLF